METDPQRMKMPFLRLEARTWIWSGRAHRSPQLLSSVHPDEHVQESLLSVFHAPLARRSRRNAQSI